MNIENVQVDHFRIPLPVVLSDSTHGEMSHFGLVTVRIDRTDGQQGLGYTYCVGDAGGDAIRSLVERDLAPVLLGLPSDAVEEIWDRMWWHLHFVGRGGIAAFAMAAVDIALWDLRAKSVDQPLWRFLGGEDPNVTAYAGGIDLQFSLDELEAQTRGFLDSGFRAIKMKVGRDELAEDKERVTAMRDWLGSDIALMADANMRWTVEQAISAARALQPCDLTWLEEPTIPDDVQGHARIARDGGIPIATGENLHTVYEFEHMIANGGVAFPEPDVATIGGISPWLRVARAAQEANLPVTTHGVHDLQVHLLAAIPNASYLEVHGFGLDRFMANPLVIEDGMARAPERPGHGVKLNWEELSYHRVAGASPI
ncbi:MAG: uroporphyrinogen decarboxylase [Gammaproteobacteria bacterium]|nr:mandelate racemase/muconate lactonizing enzyme family protein [Gammaproteobacteria bacterium]NIP89082.1 mandelate racemase/muconate lactonizing enzyme family protein [Gammaproteobacteria bacterium]NIR23946.1 mandelate racemase/muconate lactonizing enzyme family protein [Gammaproteobacteria bacterium]NIS05580.1 mandelate racemase/muconate lactonizing enzyme family protein [Gammaproteobacteria bacterium]NIU40894.1 uroporphyrinogen decarboxylase [Gammaproteobacteria bacterium]